MKAAFNIPSEGTGNSSLSLLIEAGDHGISFIWFTKAPFLVKGVAVYNIVDGYTAMDIRNIFNSQEIYLTGLSSVTICYDFKESILIPEKYNHAAINEEALSLIYGEDDNVILNKDLVTSASIYNHYRIPKQIEVVFAQRFPKADIFHATSLQLEQLSQEKNLLYCVIYHNVLKAILYKDGKLQIVQQFGYISPEDVAYYLLNVCEQFGVKPTETKLRLSGMVDEHSKLYMGLCNYFLDISFENVADNIYAQEELKKLPAHFFSHLTALALCVS
ncbi:MAG: DUF3822 family protein [Ferruginibacter sp.]